MTLRAVLKKRKIKSEHAGGGFTNRRAVYFLLTQYSILLLELQAFESHTSVCIGTISYFKDIFGYKNIIWTNNKYCLGDNFFLEKFCQNRLTF